MKLPAGEPRDGRPHEYCMRCLKSGMQRRHYRKTAADYFVCGHCGHRDNRVIFIDPKVSWWLDDQRNIWHETVGIIISNDRGHILLFQRRLFPLQVTVPAGHLEVALSPLQNAVQELSEETGLRRVRLSPLAEFDDPGDSCIRGADAHHWRVFIGHVTGEPTVTTNHEGKESFWATPAQALTLDLTTPTRYIMEHSDDYALR